MATCLSPLTLRNPGLSNSPHSCPVSFWRDSIRPYHQEMLVVPCGKCINCLRNKQSSMVVRIKREAEKRGTLTFLTLTYDDDHLPLAQSLWSVDKRTGEFKMETPAEIISSGRFPQPFRLNQIRRIGSGPVPRYLDVPIPEFSFADPDKEFFARITPSVCREDVRLWIKRCRVAYKRAFDKALSFSYVSVAEYGPRTCRPHYHLAIMGLQKDTVDWLAKQWNYGFTKCDFIPRVSGSSDPWSGVAFYIGKYMSKGKFECPSVLNHSAEKPRVCQSLGLGIGDFDALRPYVCAFDLFGRYDLDLLTLENGKRLTEGQLRVLCEEIPKRLVYRLNEKVVLPLPRLIRNRIFFHHGQLSSSEICDKSKDSFKKPVKTSIWYLVTLALRDKYAALRQQEFIEFCTSHPERTMSENCAAFEDSKDFASAMEAASRETDLQEFYARSIF